jgi:hypothetical protein
MNPATVAARQQSVWLLYCIGVHSYADLSRWTGFSNVLCRQIVRKKLAEGAGRDIEDFRNTSWAHLEMLRIELEPAIHITRNPLDGSLLPEGVRVTPHKDDVSSYIKIIHEQALLTGTHAPKQVAITGDAPTVNEEAAAAQRLVRFMTLSEKMAAVGPGRRGLTAQEADDIIVADTAEPTTPELLQEYEAQRVEPAPSSVPINFDC